MVTEELDRPELAPDLAGASSFVLALREELRRGRLSCLEPFALGDLQVEVCSGSDSVWAIIRRLACSVRHWVVLGGLGTEHIDDQARQFGGRAHPQGFIVHAQAVARPCGGG